MPGPNKEMARVARNLIRENEDVRLTVKALEARGVLRRKAELEIGRAFLRCLWEAGHGMPDRWPAVLRGLREGKSSAELFPEELHDGKAQSPQRTGSSSPLRRPDSGGRCAAARSRSARRTAASASARRAAGERGLQASTIFMVDRPSE